MDEIEDEMEQSYDSYADESFELSHSNHSVNKSPGKPKKQFEQPAEINEDCDDEEVQDDEVDRDESHFQSMNLDDFLNTYEDNDEIQLKQSENPALRSLEGVSPSPKAKRINENNFESPNQLAKERLDQVLNKVKEQSSPVLYDTMSNAELRRAAKTNDSNAARVDALLKQLNMKAKSSTPEEEVDKYAGNRFKNYPILINTSDSVANHYKYKSDDSPKKQSNDLSAGKDTGLLKSQVSQLKQDLKRRDDRLSRLTESNSLLSSKMDFMTKEITYLKQLLHNAQLEIQSQVERVEACKKNKSKGLRKKNETLTEVVNELQGENERLSKREGALLQAIDELSQQNEELMRQLKESMDRESRYTSVISSLAKDKDQSSEPHVPERRKKKNGSPKKLPPLYRSLSSKVLGYGP